MLHTLYKSQRWFFALYQGKNMTDQDLLEHFNATIMVLDQIGATWMEKDISLTKAILKNHMNGSNSDIIIKT